MVPVWGEVHLLERRRTSPLRRNLAVTETRGGAQHGALERVGQARMGARGHLVRVRVRVRVRMRMGKGLPG